LNIGKGGENMNANMTVQTSDIAAAKTTIQNQASKLQQAYTNVFNYLQKIDDAWDGDDNTEFNTRKDSFKNDFAELDVFLESLANYLQRVKDDYDNAETQTKQAAQRLAK